MTVSPFADPAALAPDADMFDDPDTTPTDKWLRGGRYRFPNRDGSDHPGGWTRVTNLVGAISDQYRLNLWQLRCLVTGLAIDQTVYADAVRLVHEVGAAGLTSANQDAVNELLERAKNAAGAGKGSERGTRVHAMVEADHLDMTPVGTVEDRALLPLYRAAVAEHFRPRQEYVERRVMIESANACGTLDNLMECLTYGTLHVVDTKTQKKFWTYLETEAQLAGYAHADAMWNSTACAWEDMPPVDRTRGAVVWLPPVLPEVNGITEPTAEVRAIDLVRGWETFQLSHRAYTLRSEAGRKRQAVSGTPWTPVVPALETWAKRLRDVDSVEDGSRVWAEAERAGAISPELRQVADEVIARFTRPRLDRY